MKPAYKSKLNLLGSIMLLLGLMLDPTFQGYMSDLVPPNIMAKILSICGIITMILRTFYTTQPIGIESKENDKV